MRRTATETVRAARSGARTGTKTVARYRDNAGIIGTCLVVAILIQARYVDAASPKLAFYLTIICVLGIAAAVTLWLTGVPAEDLDTSQTVASAPATALLEVVLIGAGVSGWLCTAISARLVASDEWNAQWWWLAGIAIPLVTVVAARASLFGRARSFLARLDPREPLGLAALFVIALALRTSAITASPPLLHGDEASCGLYGRIFNAGHTPLLSISWFGLPMLSYAISGVGLHLFGDNLTGLRLINAVIGAFSVILLYLLGREWFGRRAAAVAAVILTFTFLHLELSRDGIHYIQGPTCITLSLYLCTLWIKRGGLIPAYLAGLSFALDLQVYWSARVGPLLIAGLLGFLLLFQRRLLWARWREMVWMALGTVVSVLPVAALFRANPGTFSGHQGAVSIFSSDPNTQGHIVSQYGHISMLDLIHQQAWKVLTTFNAHPDASSLFQWWPKGMFDPVVAALLPAAVVFALFRLKRWEYTVCLAWFFSIVIAGIVTIDPPIWPRLFALVPAVCLLVGVLLAEVWELCLLAWRPRFVGVVALALALAVSAGNSLYSAFVDYPNVTRQVAMGPTFVGNFLSTAPNAGQTVMLSDGGYYLTYEPIQFLAPHAAGCTILPGMAPSTCPVWRTSRLFILLPGRVKDLPWLERQRPGGKVVPIATYDYGSAHILAYELR